MKNRFTRIVMDAMPAVLETIKQHEGLTTKEISRMSGVLYDRVYRAVAVLRKKGDIVPVRIENVCRWYTPEAGAKRLEQRHQEMLAQRREKNRISALAYSRRLAEAKRESGGGEDPLLTPRRVIVDAREPLPFPVHAPASVFAWGAAA